MNRVPHPAISELAATLTLGALLERVRRQWGSYELIDHWQQGEFHHDTVLRVRGARAQFPRAPSARPQLPGDVLLVATNCNGGVKEVLCFAQPPERGALWHARCPDNPEFAGTLPAVLASATTMHWFDPCELLSPDARSEYGAAFRERQCGGGWLPRMPAQRHSAQRH